MKGMLIAPAWSHDMNGTAEIKGRVFHTNNQRFNKPNPDANAREDVLKLQINPVQGGLGKQFKRVVRVGTMPDVIKPCIGVGFRVLHYPFLFHTVSPVTGTVNKIKRGRKNLASHRIPILRFRLVYPITHTGRHGGVSNKHIQFLARAVPERQADSLYAVF
ncbi:hypothetical protein [Akkermansia sp.]|uniref:hypothetical protein n=1 Tax=Akkermansia sp. TaxID=1872421 RepID=UPI002589AF90|nr:hypothetical protein [Akkermansia sp.]